MLDFRTCYALPTVAIVCLAGSTVVAAAPEPDPVPRRWELAVETRPLAVAYAEVPGVGSRPFYYMTYKVTNTTGKEQTLAVGFELATGDGDVVRAGRGVPVEVTKQIIEHLGNPMLQDPIGILGPIQHGRENAREGIVIWPLEDFTPESLTVYAAGFSGETAIIELPKVEGAGKGEAKAEAKAEAKSEGQSDGKGDSKPAGKGADKAKAAKAEGKDGKDAKADAPGKLARTSQDSGKVVLRKTKMIRFAVPGELTNLRDAALKVEEERWIMR